MASRDDMYKVTLKSWLYERINENVREERYKGLKWIDEDNLIFQLPWVTENDPHWRDYYKLFHDWARRDGGESTDSQKAKRNFRSALNHSKHFRNLRDKGENLQTGSYKVYKFLTQDEIAREKREKRNISEDNSSSPMTLSPDSQGFQQYTDFGKGIAMVQSDATNGMQLQNVPMLPGQYERAFQNNLNATHPYCDDNQDRPIHTTIASEYTISHAGVCEQEIHNSSIGQFSMDSDIALSITRNILAPYDLGKFQITVEYNGKTMNVQEIDIRDDAECRILYDENIAYQQPPPSANHVYLPPVDAHNEPGLHKILENMKRGIRVTCDTKRMQINIRRDCLAHAYYFTVQGPSPGSLQAMKRKQECSVFSFEVLANSLCEEQLVEGRPLQALTSNIEIVVGVQPKADQFGKSVKGVKITLHSLAVVKIHSTPLQSHEVLISTPTNSVEPMSCE